MVLFEAEIVHVGFEEVPRLVTAAAHSPRSSVDAQGTAPQTGKETDIGENDRGGERRSERKSKGTRVMSTSPPPGPGPGGVGRRIEEAVELIEMELRHAVAYVNDAVIPQVRRESIVAMRSLSDTLKNLADRIEHRQPKGPQT